MLVCVYVCLCVYVCINLFPLIDGSSHQRAAYAARMATAQQYGENKLGDERLVALEAIGDRCIRLG